MEEYGCVFMTKASLTQACSYIALGMNNLSSLIVDDFWENIFLYVTENIWRLYMTWHYFHMFVLTIYCIQGLHTMEYILLQLE